MRNDEKITILLVEDDAGDQKLITRALNAHERQYEIKCAGDGESALEYLRNSGINQSQYPRPNLILLDLNMPRMDGRQFLRQIKADDDLRSIPVVIVTISDAYEDINKSYGLHAAGYIQKSASPTQFNELIEKLAKYWFSTSKLVKIG